MSRHRHHRPPARLALRALPPHRRSASLPSAHASGQRSRQGWHCNAHNHEAHVTVCVSEYEVLKLVRV